MSLKGRISRALRKLQEITNYQSNDLPENDAVLQPRSNAYAHQRKLMAKAPKIQNSLQAMSSIASRLDHEESIQAYKPRSSGADMALNDFENSMP